MDIEAGIPAEHPLRLIRWAFSDVLASLDGEFEALYEPEGWESIPPERLLRGTLLQELSPRRRWWAEGAAPFGATVDPVGELHTQDQLWQERA